MINNIDSHYEILNSKIKNTAKSLLDNFTIVETIFRAYILIFIHTSVSYYLQKQSMNVLRAYCLVKTTIKIFKTNFKFIFSCRCSVKFSKWGNDYFEQNRFFDFSPIFDQIDLIVYNNFSI